MVLRQALRLCVSIIRWHCFGTLAAIGCFAIDVVLLHGSKAKPSDTNIALPFSIALAVIPLALWHALSALMEECDLRQRQF